MLVSICIHQAVNSNNIRGILLVCTQMLADFSSAYNNRPDLSEVLEAGPTAAADLQSARRVYHTHQRCAGYEYHNQSRGSVCSSSSKQHVIKTN
jgi:hypothetical protein